MAQRDFTSLEPLDHYATPSKPAPFGNANAGPGDADQTSHGPVSRTRPRADADPTRGPAYQSGRVEPVSDRNDRS